MELNGEIGDSRVSTKVYHYDPIKKIHYVKALLFEDLYISGIQVKPSPRHPELGLWVQFPSYKSGEKWKRYIEFKTQDNFKTIIEDACRQAATRYDNGDVLPSDSDVEDAANYVDAYLGLPI